MADLEITNLPSVTVPLPTDELAMVNDLVTKKITRAQMHSLALGENLVLPNGDDPTDPEIQFPNSGIYEDLNDELAFSQGGVKVGHLTTPAAGGLFIDNQLTGAGLERALTTADLFADQTPWASNIDGAGFDLNDAGVIFLREQAAANADVAAQGQFWVRSDTPNVPLFTDDAGTDFRLDIMTQASVPILQPSASFAGVMELRSAGNTDAEFREFIFTHQDGTSRGAIGHFAGTSFNIANDVDGGLVNIFGRNAAGDTQHTLFTGDPDGTITLFEDNNDRLLVDSLGIIIRQDTDLDTADYRIRFQTDAGTDRALVGFLGTSDFRVRNQVHGSQVFLEAEDLGGVLRVLFQGDPDASSIIYHAGGIRLLTATLGRVILRSDGSLDTENRHIRFEHADGTLRGTAGYNGTSGLQIRNGVHGGNTQLFGEDAGGVLREMLRGDPDGPTNLGYLGVFTARTDLAADGGFEINNTLTGGGFERALTTSDVTITATTTQLEQDTDPINTSAAKEEGYRVFNTVTNRPVWATGSGDTSGWVFADGTSAHVPV